MKRKIMLLIGACIFTVVALAAIQGYFIYNTYQLNEKEINVAIKKQISRLEDSEEWYNLSNVPMERIKEYVRDYSNGNANKQDLKKYIETNRDSLSNAMKVYMKKRAMPEDYDIDYSIYINSITLTDVEKTNTLFKGKILALANDTLKKNHILSSEGRWQNSDNDVQLSMVVKSNRYYSFDELQKTIISKMAGLLIFSVVLMAFVVFLYYMSLKNLIGQKRIADIKTDFVNNITHEFQTPLATMDLAIKTLQRKDEQITAEHQANTLAMIARQNERLQKLFRQVTEVSISPVANLESIQISCVDIKEMVNDFKLSKPDINIVCSQEKPEINITIDRFHLNTILLNLMDNAVKYGAKNIDVNLNITTSHFELTVKDDGKGIPMQEQVSIFDKFYRIEKGNVHNTKGLGLGLFYIKQLVEIYKGKIKVESEENKGAQFIITIPV